MGCYATLLCFNDEFSFDEVFRYYRFVGCMTMIDCYLYTIGTKV